MSENYQLTEHPVHYFNPMVDLTKIKRVVFDMDGTIYKGGTLFPFTKNVFETLEKIGVDYTFLTNNSSKSAKDYLAKILKPAYQCYLFAYILQPELVTMMCSSLHVSSFLWDHSHEHTNIL